MEIRPGRTPEPPDSPAAPPASSFLSYGDAGSRAGVSGVLAPAAELALYRMQEALCDAEHSHAARVRVRVTHTGGSVETVVEDDGIGFSVPNTEAEDVCLGLFWMRERAAYAGGSVRVESAPGEGTRVIISLAAAG
ncbi:MAG TPA: ATP-binding protein [Longimicrobium sp.]